MAQTLKQNKFWLERCKDTKYESIRQTIRSTFKDIVFDEAPHKYYLHGEELECVSNITHIFKPHIDGDRLAEETYARNYNNANSKYYRMTVEEIKAQWKRISEDACETGTQRHNFGESVFYWMTEDYDSIPEEFADRFSFDDNGERIVTAKYPKEEAILDFWRDLPDCFIPILAENRVYNVNEYYRYCGTFDILFYYDSTVIGKPEEQSGLCIFDYKTNKDLYKNFKGETLLPPFDELLNNDLNIYKLQLAAYQLCLERIGLKIIARRLIWLRPSGEYEKVPLESLADRLDKALIEHFRKK